MRTDFENLQDGDQVTLYPSVENPLHRTPIVATYSGGYFYCEGTNPEKGPDYYLGDVLRFNEGFTQP